MTAGVSLVHGIAIVSLVHGQKLQQDARAIMLTVITHFETLMPIDAEIPMKCTINMRPRAASEIVLQLEKR